MRPPQKPESHVVPAKPTATASHEDREAHEHEREIRDHTGEADASGNGEHERPDAAMVLRSPMLPVSCNVLIRHENTSPDRAKSAPSNEGCETRTVTSKAFYRNPLCGDSGDLRPAAFWSPSR